MIDYYTPLVGNKLLSFLIFNTHYTALLGHASNYCPSPYDPFDLLNEFFLKHSSKDIDQIRKMQIKGIGFLKTCIRNLAKDKARKGKSHSKYLASVSAESIKYIPTIEDQILIEKVKDTAKDILEDIEFQMWVKYLNGDTQKEIADDMGKNRKTVTGIIRRSRIKLGKHFGRGYFSA